MLGYFLVNHLSFVERRDLTLEGEKKPCHLYNENSFLRIDNCHIDCKLSGNLQHVSRSLKAQYLYPSRGTSFEYLKLFLEPFTAGVANSHIFTNGMVAQQSAYHTVHCSSITMNGRIFQT